jgi:translation initiation factor 3 subunit J
LKQKIAEKQAAEEQKKKELEAKKLAGEDEKEEDAYERKERLRRMELEADMANATDLFSGVTVCKLLSLFFLTCDVLTFLCLADMKDKPLEEWRPKNRVEMDAFRKRLVEIITPASVSMIMHVRIF